MVIPIDPASVLNVKVIFNSEPVNCPVWVYRWNGQVAASQPVMGLGLGVGCLLIPGPVFFFFWLVGLEF